MPALLVALSAFPVAFGAFRLSQLGSGAEVTPDNARFFAAPVPVVLHVLSISVYSLLGAFQFSAAFRRRRPRWHRTAGRILIPTGIIAATTGLWMQATYQLPDHDGEALVVLRWLFGTAMLAALILAVAAIRRRDFNRHGAWMTRAYAIGLGAGTQALIGVPWALLIGQPNEAVYPFLMGAGWVINATVAECLILRHRNRRSPRIHY